MTPYDGNFRKRLTSLVKALVLVAATATMVSGKSALAQNKCWFGNNIPTTSGTPLCDSSFMFDQVFDKKLTVATYPTVGKGTVEFGADRRGNNYFVRVTFAPDLIQDDFYDINNNLTSGIFNYTMSITRAGNTFNLLGVDSLVSLNPDTRVTKTILNDSPVLSLTSVNGGNVTAAFTTRTLTSIQVSDSYEVNDFDSIMYNFENSFTQVSGIPPQNQPAPGPLPLLGATAAYGYSRRLRGRISGARRPL